MDKFHLEELESTKVLTSYSTKRLNSRSESPRFTKCRQSLKLIAKNLKKFIARETKEGKKKNSIQKAGINQKRINMPGKIKMRSASVEDLGNIVKRMIDGVLEDNDQVVKLRHAVFKEYYFKKMEELKQVKAEIDTDYNLNQTAKQSEINTPDSQLSLKQQNFKTYNTEPENVQILAAPLSHDVKRSESHELFSQKSNRTTLVDFLHTEATIPGSFKSETILNSEKADGKSTSNFLIDEVNPSMIRVIRRQKYVKISQESNIALASADCNTTMDVTQVVNDSKKNEEHINIESGRKASSNVEIIKCWSSASGEGALEDNNQLEKARDIPVQFKSKGEIAFENWKKAKSKAYHRVFREEQKRKLLEQTAKAKQIEKKEAANEAYLYWRRQQDARQKLSNTRKQILAKMESQKRQSNEKSRVNSQAFKVWKRQKDIKLRERKMYMMAYGGQNYSQQQTKPQKPAPCIDVTFNMWLDQLDFVLHQKYLRERRYLVRSFYCQPAYFGTAALYG